MRINSPDLERPMDAFEWVSGCAFPAAPANASGKTEQIIDRAMTKLVEIASQPERFREILGKALGSHHDKDAAERIRLDILAGNTSWMPTVALADRDDLGGALGAYDQNTGTVYLQRELVSPRLAADVLLEEIGHHLDRLLNRADSAGDEGEIFRRLIVGENLSDPALASLRDQDDHGIMLIDGRAVQVENWGLDWVTDWIWNSKPVRDTVRETTDRIVQTLTNVGVRINAATQGWVDDLVANAKAYGTDLLQSCEKIAGGMAKLTRGDLSGLTDIWSGLQNASFANFHAFARLTLDTVSAVQTAVGLERIGRGLRADEVAQLRKVFGDTIDYSKVVVKEGGAGIFAGDRALTMGNTIYMKDDRTWETLVHEMTHVWQFQNGGNDYMLKAGWAQFSGWLQGNSGYEWWHDIHRGWEALNPEQQAKLIEDGTGYFRALEQWDQRVAAFEARVAARRFPIGMGTPRPPAERLAVAEERARLAADRPKFEYNGVDYTAQLEDAWNKLRARVGAP